MSDFIELGIPPKKNNVLFLLQKALFAYRSFENRWNMVPRPKIFNNLVRFIFRLFGFNFNLKKLSHWAIPDLIFNYIDYYAGLNSRILFIITDQEKNKDRKPSRGIIFKDSCDHIFLLEFVESTLERISTINKEKLFPRINNPISSIKEKVGEKYKYLFKAFDPEDDEIAEYIVNWGDNNQENITGPFVSGVYVNASHTWYQKGNFTMKVIAKDIVGAESIWGYLEITMPRNRIAHNSLFLQFLERFPNMFPILRYLLGL